MTRILRILSIIIGVFLGITAVNWMFNPSNAAMDLGMDLLTGMGRNTQIGDMTAFFTTGSLFILLGVFKNRPDFLVVPAFLMVSAAFFRLTSGAFYDSDIVVEAVIFEVLSALILFSYSRKI
jgi:hypothetical protein